MPVTARERAEKALDKINVEIEKAHEKYQKLAAKRDDAKAKAEEAGAALKALTAERDHLATHPALQGEAPAQTTEPGPVVDETFADPVQEPEPAVQEAEPTNRTDDAPVAQSAQIAAKFTGQPAQNGVASSDAFDPFK